MILSTSTLKAEGEKYLKVLEKDFIQLGIVLKKYETNSFFWEKLNSKEFDKYFYYKIDLFEVVNGATSGEYRISYTLLNRYNDYVIYNHNYTFKIEKKSAKINWKPIIIISACLGAILTGSIVYLGVKLKPILQK